MFYLYFTNTQVLPQVPEENFQTFSNTKLLPQVPEEHFLNDSASNSGDSALEDNVDYNEEEIYYPSSLPKTGCLSPTNHVADKVEFGGVETSVTNSENDSSYTTPETGVSTSSFMEVQSSVDALGTSTSENEVRVIRRGNVHLKPIQSTSKVEYEGKRVEWSVSSAVMEIFCLTLSKCIQTTLLK
ncbi:hypothetical protein Avbf_16370 [Armadillidium vulgare]|nr:hypothetical protein Avbf_16370 [Armadillidium vulgare]